MDSERCRLRQRVEEHPMSRGRRPNSPRRRAPADHASTRWCCTARGCRSRSRSRPSWRCCCWIFAPALIGLADRKPARQHAFGLRQRDHARCILLVGDVSAAWTAVRHDDRERLCRLQARASASGASPANPIPPSNYSPAGAADPGGQDRSRSTNMSALSSLSGFTGTFTKLGTDRAAADDRGAHADLRGTGIAADSTRRARRTSST